MANNVASISVVRMLHELELFYFSSRTLADLLGRDLPQIHLLVRQLVRAGFVAEVENGKYLLLGFEPERILANPLFIGSHLVTPGYVSYWSALHAYGFTEQAPLLVYVATTKKKLPVEYAGQRFRFVTIHPRKFFGYRREQMGGLPVLMADEAKALIDSLGEPELAGGITEVAKALRTAIETVDINTLVEYANRIGDKTLGSRLGYLLGLLGRAVIPCDGAPAPVDGLATPQLIRSTSSVKLDPGRLRQGRRDPQWRIDINVPLEELRGQGIG